MVYNRPSSLGVTQVICLILNSNSDPVLLIVTINYEVTTAWAILYNKKHIELFSMESYH